MSAVLSWNRYGKSRVRLVKVRRTPERHDVVDLTIDVRLEGAFEPVYVEHDNRMCLPTDTMKNTVYAFARHDPIEHVEAFCLHLANHFAGKPLVSRVWICANEHRWDRLCTGDRPHPHAFVQPGVETWTALVSRDGAHCEIMSGLTNLVLLKTTDSAFLGFPRDEFTTLSDAEDRLLATSVTAQWRYQSDMSDFSARAAIRTALVETFAGHQSRSVQHTLYAMGEAALAACDAITEITLTLPNRHHLLVDLQPFGLDNPNEVFVATEQPFGLIEATVRR
ncbi:MAG: urate oxidase [Blastocatellia bacterium]|nr:MAG: urate oxidase [Blastocatellia bacterium]